MVSTRLIRSRGSLQKQMSMDQDLLVCVVSERSKLKKMTQWNRQPKETRNQESNRTEQKQRHPSEGSAFRHRIRVHQCGATGQRLTGEHLGKTSCHRGRRHIRSQDSPRGGINRIPTPSRAGRAPGVRAPARPPRQRHHHSIVCLGVDSRQEGCRTRRRRHSR